MGFPEKVVHRKHCWVSHSWYKMGGRGEDREGKGGLGEGRGSCHQLFS